MDKMCKKYIYEEREKYVREELRGLWCHLCGYDLFNLQRCIDLNLPQSYMFGALINFGYVVCVVISSS